MIDIKKKIVNCVFCSEKNSLNGNCFDLHIRTHNYICFSKYDESIKVATQDPLKQLQVNCRNSCFKLFSPKQASITVPKELNQKLYLIHKHQHSKCALFQVEDSSLHQRNFMKMKVYPMNFTEELASRHVDIFHLILQKFLDGS